MTNIDEQIKNAQLEKIQTETKFLKKKNSRWGPTMIMAGTLATAVLTVFTGWNQHTRSSIEDRESSLDARVASIEARESVLAIDTELKKKEQFLPDRETELQIKNDKINSLALKIDSEENRLQQVQNEIETAAELLAEVATDAGADSGQVTVLKEEVIKLSRPTAPTIAMITNLQPLPNTDTRYRLPRERPSGAVKR